jgi:transposase
MSYGRGEVLGRVERRRRFSLEEKISVLAEACAPGAVISEVARRHGLLPSQVFKWRRLAALGVIGIPGASELPSFVAVEVAADAAVEPETVVAESVGEVPAKEVVPARTPPSKYRERRSGLIEIDLGRGRCVRVDSDVDADALRRVLDVLDRR